MQAVHQSLLCGVTVTGAGAEAGAACSAAARLGKRPLVPTLTRPPPTETPTPVETRPSLPTPTPIPTWGPIGMLTPKFTPVLEHPVIPAATASAHANRLPGTRGWRCSQARKLDRPAWDAAWPSPRALVKLGVYGLFCIERSGYTKQPSRARAALLKHLFTNFVH